MTTKVSRSEEFHIGNSLGTWSIQNGHSMLWELLIDFSVLGSRAIFCDFSQWLPFKMITSRPNCMGNASWYPCSILQYLGCRTVFVIFRNGGNLKWLTNPIKDGNHFIVKGSERSTPPTFLSVLCKSLFHAYCKISSWVLPEKKHSKRIREPFR